MGLSSWFVIFGIFIPDSLVIRIDFYIFCYWILALWLRFRFFLNGESRSIWFSRFLKVSWLWFCIMAILIINSSIWCNGSLFLWFLEFFVIFIILSHSFSYPVYLITLVQMTVRKFPYSYKYTHSNQLLSFFDSITLPNTDNQTTNWHPVFTMLNNSITIYTFLLSLKLFFILFLSY